MHLTADAELSSHVFGGHAHVNVVEGVVQSANHHVHHLGVAHAGAPAAGQAGIRCTAHVFSATADSNIAVTQGNGLAGADDGLQARAAQTINVERGRALCTTTVDGRNARQVHVLGLGVDHMTKHNMADILAIRAGTSQGFADNQCGQFGRRGVFEAATIGANSCTNCADDDDFTAHGICLRLY